MYHKHLKATKSKTGTKGRANFPLHPRKKAFLATAAQDTCHELAEARSRLSLPIRMTRDQKKRQLRDCIFVSPFSNLPQLTGVISASPKSIFATG